MTERKRQRFLAGFDADVETAASPSPPLESANPASLESAAPGETAAPAESAAPAEAPAQADSVEPGRDMAGEFAFPAAPAVSNAPEAREAPGAPTEADADAPPALHGQTVYVLDAHALLYQLFHALPEMTSPTGQPVGAAHGFLRDVVDILEKKRPDYLLCAFDAPGDTFRHSAYAEYKAQRAAMPDDLVPQIASAQRLLAALGVPALLAPGFAADDILATIARRVVEAGGQCVLVTSDKDCRQLLGAGVRMFNIRKNQFLDAAGVRDDWGVTPEQVVDYQGLVGDSVDNVPGVPGVGPKTAALLLQTYGTLERVLDAAGSIQLKGVGKSVNAKLREHRAAALLSRDLARLKSDVPVIIDWADAKRLERFDVEATEALCREFGFRSLADRARQLALEHRPQAEPRAEWVADYQAIATPEAFAEFVQRLAGQSRFVLDTETTSPNPRWAELVGLSFCWTPGQAYYVPVRAPAGEPRLDQNAVLAALRPILENAAVEKIGQNLKYEMVVLRSHGVELRGAAFDTMVADYLLEAGERNHNLDDLTRRYLRHQKIKISELIGVGKKQIGMDQVPLSLITRYAAEDADAPLRLERLLAARLDAEGLRALFSTLEMPLIRVLAEMEFNGARVDVEHLRGLSRRYGEKLATLEQEIYAAAGQEFNIDSPQQLAAVLFDKLGLPVVKRTKTGPSTDAEVLEDLAERHALPAKVLAYRQFGKLKSTYVDALPELVCPRTGRVHTSFKQDVAATGRLSSSDPNLQNIPVRAAEGREIRAAFVPETGWRLLTADYSQIELRLLAHFSGDAALLRAFAEDQDIHARVASEVYNTPLAEVAPDQRRSAKAINFGVIYGQSPFGLAKELGLAKDQAAAFIDAYFARYPGVEAFMEQVLEGARTNGFVGTIAGRRRVVRGVRDPAERGAPRHRNQPERVAVNTVIQGSAADIIKQAMIRVHARLERERLRARLLLQIHDELVFEAPPDELPALRRLVVEEMTRVENLRTPLKVDVKTGLNWAACEA